MRESNDDLLYGTRVSMEAMKVKACIDFSDLDMFNAVSSGYSALELSSNHLFFACINEG